MTDCVTNLILFLESKYFRRSYVINQTNSAGGFRTSGKINARLFNGFTTLTLKWYPRVHKSEKHENMHRLMISQSHYLTTDQTIKESRKIFPRWRITEVVRCEKMTYHAIWMNRMDEMGRELLKNFALHCNLSVTQFRFVGTFTSLPLTPQLGVIDFERSLRISNFLSCFCHSYFTSSPCDSPSRISVPRVFRGTGKRSWSLLTLI